MEEFEWEDMRAREADVHRHACSEGLERRRFVLRVDHAKHVREKALRSGRRAVRLVERLLGEDGRLGREQIGRLLEETALTGCEQMRVEDGSLLAVFSKQMRLPLR